MEDQSPENGQIEEIKETLDRILDRTVDDNSQILESIQRISDTIDRCIAILEETNKKLVEHENKPRRQILPSIDIHKEPWAWLLPTIIGYSIWALLYFFYF